MLRIETEPLHQGIYIDQSAREDAFKLRRYTDDRERSGGFTGWQRSAGWVPSNAPVNPQRLVNGPVLVMAVKEPIGIGAVVVEYMSNRIWLGDGTGVWRSGPDLAAWSALEYPTVRSHGMSEALVRLGNS